MSERNRMRPKEALAPHLEPMAGKYEMDGPGGVRWCRYSLNGSWPTMCDLPEVPGLGAGV
jgi:hypothetical protein